MFSNIGFGWAKLTFPRTKRMNSNDIVEFSTQCSYLTDPVFDFGNAIADALDFKYSVVHTDAEGYDVDVIFSDRFYIVSVTDAHSPIYDIEDSIEEIATDWLKDAREHFDKWCDWNGNYDDDDFHLEQRNRKKELQKLIDKVEVMMKKREQIIKSHYRAAM